MKNIVIRCKASVRILGHASKTKHEKKNISSAISSQQISGKTLGVNKPDIKKFLKQKICRSETTYKPNAYNMSGVRRYAVILTNYVCINVIDRFVQNFVIEKFLQNFVFDKFLQNFVIEKFLQNFVIEKFLQNFIIDKFL